MVYAELFFLNESELVLVFVPKVAVKLEMFLMVVWAGKFT